MISIIRWVVAIPCGVMAAFIAHMLSGVAFGIGHGFELIATFWDAIDMNGMPISGTYIIFVTRTVTLAVLIGTITYIVPSHNRNVAIVLFALFAISVIVFMTYGAISINKSMPSVSFGFWYRTILESISMILGAAVGGGVGVELSKKTA